LEQWPHTHNWKYQEKSKKYFPVLSQAAADIGSPQIRNRGTIGGNIVNASPAGDLLPPLMAYQAQFKLVSAKKNAYSC